MSDGSGLELQRLAVMAAKNMVSRCWVVRERQRMHGIGNDEKLVLRDAIVEALCTARLSVRSSIQCSAHRT
eukprot:SAG31_NODE_1615_length_7737_cov_5.540848_4_plen_71_part_00